MTEIDPDMTKLELAVFNLIEFASNGEFVSELNGYEADERPIDGTPYRVCKIVNDNDDGEVALRIENNGEILAWATVNTNQTIVRFSNSKILIYVAGLL